MMKNDTVWYKYILSFLVVFFSLLVPESVQATHIRAGEITAKSDTANPANPLRFHFKLVTYTVLGSQIDDQTATFFFGDGSNATVPRFSRVNIGNNTYRQVFYVSHNFPGPGIFTVLYNEENRNASVVNIHLPSMNSFLVQTTISIIPQIGINRTPQFSVPPLDIAAQGQIFIHFPGAYDLDQDSLAYRLVTPLRNTSLSSNPIPGPVTGYRFPNDISFGGSTIPDPIMGEPGGNNPRFDLNRVTGEIRWNVPNTLGEYNIAFIVEEWKRVPGKVSIKIGEVTRDMQIRVEGTTNIRPALIVPRDTCIIANTQLRGTVTGSDPNSPPDPLVFNAYSGIIPPATFVQNSGSSGIFQWTPQCTDISEQPYQVIFKVTDQPGNNNPPLIDMKAWNVTVVGPKPTGLTATLQPGKQMLLTWNPYLTNGCGNAEKIHIYRRVNRANFNPTNCITGVPASTGYVKIGEVPASQSSFTDTNAGIGLKAGSNYCYVIYASFPNPKKGESLASVETCAEVPVLGSLLTNVDVTETSKTTGKIQVKWSRPLKGAPTGNFEYRLSRAFGITGNQPYTLVYSSSTLNDTVFLDNNLNTLDSAYHYKIEYLEQGGNGVLTLLEPGNEGSSARLSAESDGTNMDLKWRYETPWDNSQRKHIIYRRINNAFVAIDSVQASPSQGTYTDRGTFNNEPLKFGNEYCYYVETVGVFSKAKLPKVVFNRSQIFCQIVRDTTAPCPPMLNLALLNCDSLERTTFNPPFENKLKWQPATGNECGTDVASYNVYFRQNDGEEFKLISSTPTLAYVHLNLPVPTGCYAVTAVDSSGNESRQSNIVCQEVCYFLEFPNIITPNRDNLNDTFRPSNSAFIKSVKFSVYNRWGMKIYSQTTGPNIDWAGVNDNGDRTADGVYYYLAEVEFAGSDPKTSRKTYKGWVEVLSQRTFLD